MILKSKICGVSDSKTLNYLVNHKHPPQFVGFIVNYPKSNRYVDKKKLSEEEIFEMATNSGAKDCFNLDNYHEVISEKEHFYKVKSEFEKKLDNIQYSGIEWRPFSYLDLTKEQSKKILEILEFLEELDDVQNTYTNANLDTIKL